MKRVGREEGLLKKGREETERYEPFPQRTFRKKRKGSTLCFCVRGKEMCRAPWSAGKGKKPNNFGGGGKKKGRRLKKRDAEHKGGAYLSSEQEVVPFGIAPAATKGGLLFILYEGPEVRGADRFVRWGGGEDSKHKVKRAYKEEGGERN